MEKKYVVNAEGMAWPNDGISVHAKAVLLNCFLNVAEHGEIYYGESESSIPELSQDNVETLKVELANLKERASFESKLRESIIKRIFSKYLSEFYQQNKQDEADYSIMWGSIKVKYEKLIAEGNKNIIEILEQVLSDNDTGELNYIRDNGRNISVNYLVTIAKWALKNKNEFENYVRSQIENGTEQGLKSPEETSLNLNHETNTSAEEKNGKVNRFGNLSRLLVDKSPKTRKKIDFEKFWKRRGYSVTNNQILETQRELEAEANSFKVMPEDIQSGKIQSLPKYIPLTKKTLHSVLGMVFGQNSSANVENK